MQDKGTIIEQLIEENKQLREHIKLLEEKIARLEKNSNNSSRPPSSDIVKAKKTVLKVGRRKRKRGGEHKLTKKLASRFKRKAAENYFRFLTEPDIEPTNNGTERQIRPVVIDRRITQGTRGDTGMRRCERIWTAIATCKKQQRNVFDFIHESVIAHWSNKKYPSLICQKP